MTCHYILEDSYRRKSHVLACKRMKSNHTHLKIASMMHNIHKEFEIDGSKITHTVTDNATNFGKAFKVYANYTQMTQAEEKHKTIQDEMSAKTFYKRSPDFSWQDESDENDQDDVEDSAGIVY